MMEHDVANTALSTQAAAPAPAAKSSGRDIRGGLLAAMTPNTPDEAYRLSKALSLAGDMIPKHFQGKPEAIMAAIMQGAQVGLAPMQALQYIAVINGRPTVWGDALPAMVMAAGHFVDVEMEGAGKDRAAVATLTRKDGRKIVRRFSWADADRAGLTKKPGPWQQYPERMMQMRARAFAIRDGAPDALLGLSIAEEVMDYGPDAARDVTPRQAAPRPGRAMYVDPDPVIDEIHDVVPAQIEGPSDLSPTADDLARAEAEALAAICRHDAEAEQGRLV